MRKISAIAVAVGMSATMTACAGFPGSNGCEPGITSGGASSIINAPGKFASAPRVDFPTPIVTYETEATELISGDGDLLTDGQPVRIKLSIFNGRTGEEIPNGDSDMITMVGGTAIPAVGPALECSTVGSRIAIAASAEAAHGSQPFPDAGVEAEDTFVFVADVLDSYLAKANGAPQLAKAGQPAVVLAPNGAPGITVPGSGNEAADPPEELVVSVLKAGDGAELKEGDQAILHYTGVMWSNNEVFDSSWSKGTAGVFSLAEGVIPGFKDGLIGQKIGSQVLLVIPPELGYGDTGSGSIPAGETLVFVVDILGASD